MTTFFLWLYCRADRRHLRSTREAWEHPFHALSCMRCQILVNLERIVIGDFALTDMTKVMLKTSMMMKWKAKCLLMRTLLRTMILLPLLPLWRKIVENVQTKQIAHIVLSCSTVDEKEYTFLVPYKWMDLFWTTHDRVQLAKIGWIFHHLILVPIYS